MAVSISISITQNSQNITNNTSNVTVKVIAKWTGGSYNALVNASGTPQAKGWVKIDGKSYDFASTFNTGKTTTGSQTICTKTVNVTHTSTGAKTLSCSASYTTGVSSGTVTASASKTLTTIPRKSTLSVANGTLGTKQTLTVTRQSTSFTHTITATCGSASTTICTKSTSTSISFTPPIGWASQNTTGTSVSVKYTITTYNGSTSVGSNSYTKTCTIPASVVPTCTISVSDADGYYDTYGVYLRGVSKLSVTVTATIAYGSAISSYKTTVDGVAYSGSSFTTDTLTTPGTLTIKTTVTDKRGRTGTATVSIPVHNYIAPYVNNLSVHRCVLKKGAEIDTNDVYIDSETLLTDVFTTTGEQVYAYGDLRIPDYFCKIDSVYYDVSVVNNDDGGYVNAVFSPIVDATLDVAAGLTSSYGVSYKKTTDSNYISSDGYMVEHDQVEYLFPADVSSSYNVKVVITDMIGNQSSRIVNVSTGYTVMHWSADGLAMGIGKLSEQPEGHERLLDIGMETRFTGGILHPIIEPETDLNDVLTPNTYMGANVSNYKYVNCPLTTGTFTLEVVGMGAEGQVKQRLTYCHKESSRTWERIYHKTGDVMSWGEWICVSDFDGQLLWQGGFFMHDTQEINLAEPVSKQRAGIVLVFSRYSSGEIQNYHFTYHFVPKMMVAMHPGCGSTFYMGAVEGDYLAAKYLYISDTSIKGNAYNDDVITDANNGIKYTNNATVLRYVIGV